jgi:ribosome-associated toxin RatA of RatAB toxin-antitoxin module
MPLEFFPDMRRVQRNAIVAFTPDQMFDLVVDFESYPEFLPWCEASELRSKTEEEIIGGITLGIKGFNASFVTRNILHRPSLMNMALEEGPFKVLEGAWEFQALGSEGCKVSLVIDFEFESSMQDMLLGGSFELICNKLIDAFSERAKLVYGDES